MLSHKKSSAGRRSQWGGALTFFPVTRDTFPDFEAFFESPGAPKFCWCMVWRRTAEEARHHSGPERRQQMIARLDTGMPVGLLAYDGDTPVGWVSIAPRHTYRKLGGRPAEPGESVWSLVCFFVPRRLRGQGMTRRLIAGAIDYARTNGATAVEAYPVDAEAPSYRFMGFAHVFSDMGFAEVGRAGYRRHVMRLSLA